MITDTYRQYLKSIKFTDINIKMWITASSRRALPRLLERLGPTSIHYYVLQSLNSSIINRADAKIEKTVLISVHPETLVFEAPELLVREYFS
jgi:hypothetical protein